jgi:hypothetical protein
MSRNTRISRFRRALASSKSAFALPRGRMLPLAFAFILASGSAFGYTRSGSTYATNGSASDVQSAISGAPNGSTVIIPNGTYGWSTGITCTKAITIQGASIGGVTITDNMSGAVVDLTPSTAGNLTFSNVIFKQGSVSSKSAQHYIVVEYSPGSQPILIHDCQFFSAGSVLSQILWSQNGGVIWNCHFDGGNTGTNITSVDEGIQFKTPGVDRWKTPSTMGMAGDPNGTLNTYVEDCTFNNFYTEATDCDDGSRNVFRHCTFTKAVCASHGADTSPYGNRHWEYYDNSWIYPYASGDPQAVNMNSPIIMRGGTGVITGNSFCPQSTSQWGVRSSITWLSDAVTQVRCYSTYPIPRALGQGWSGGSGSYSYAQAPEMGAGYISEPIYVWGNTTNNTYQTTGNADTYGYANNTGCANGLTTQQFIVSGRDFFFDSGAKPGWSRYTYPHPLRNGAGSQSVSNGAGSQSVPAAPQNLRVN